MPRPVSTGRATGYDVMDQEALVRVGLELVIVIAVGGMLVSALRRLLKGQVTVHRCPACERPTTRANPRCRHCGAAVGPDA